MILVYISALIITFYLLAIITDEFFVETLENISTKAKIPPAVAGATLMAMGSSAPELFTALGSVLQNGGEHASLGAGTILGSAIFNILVIIGASSMFEQAKLTWQSVIRDLLFYSFSILLVLLTFKDGQITFLEVNVYILVYGIYIYAVKNWQSWFNYTEENPVDILEEETTKNPINAAVTKYLNYIIPTPKPEDSVFVKAASKVPVLQKYVKPASPQRVWASFLSSIILIGILSHIMVESGIHLAEWFSVSDALIGLTVLAFGTSVPDLLSSMIVAKKGRGDMAIANAVGSNIFDILAGLGIPYFVFFGLNGLGSFVPVDTENLIATVVLLFATVVSVLFLLIARRWKLGKKSGLVLIALYIAYLGYNIFTVL